MLLPLFLTLSVQCIIALGMVALPVLLPAYAAELSIGAEFAGGATAAVYGGAAATAFLLSSRVRAFGSIRTCQISLLVVGAGMVLSATGTPIALLAGAFALGLGYGPVTAASASLLTRVAPAGSLGLVFSVNRMSIPIGAALAGTLLPALSGSIGWRISLVGIGSASLLLAALLQGARWLDTGDPAHGVSVPATRFLEPLRLLFLHRKRRALTLASLIYLAAQSCLAAFTVAFLVGELAMSYASAGVILAAAQMSGMVARLAMGFAADRSRRRMAFMGFIGLMTATALGLATFARPAWPHAAIVAIFMLYGAGALGWHGIMLAELAQTTSPERAGEVAGASSAVAFVGAVAGPGLFSFLLAFTGYAGAFTLLGVCVFASSVKLIRFEPRHTI